MQHYINTKRAKQRKTRQFLNIMANTALLLIVLFATILALTYQLSPQSADSPAILILLGIISTAVGLHAGNQLTKLPIPHDTLDAALKGFPQTSALYHFHLPADHVLITPNTIYTITPHPQDATITFTNNHLKLHDSLPKRLLRFLLQNSIGDPFSNAHSDAQRLTTWLHDNLPGQDAPIQPLLVFTNPKATITIHGQPSIPILYADKRKPSLKAFLKAHQRHNTQSQPVTPAQVNAILALTEEDAY